MPTLRLARDHHRLSLLRLRPVPGEARRARDGEVVEEQLRVAAHGDDGLVVAHRHSPAVAHVDAHIHNLRGAAAGEQQLDSVEPLPH